MTIARRTQRVRQAVKANHVAAVQRAEAAVGRFNRLGAGLKQELLRVAIDGGPGADQRARLLFAELARRIQANLDDWLRRQAVLAQRQAAQAVGVKPVPGVADALVPPNDHRRNLLPLAGLLAASAAVGVVAGRVGVRLNGSPGPGFAGAALAVDRLVGSANSIIRQQSVWVSNQAVRAVVEGRIPSIPTPQLRPLLRPPIPARILPVATPLPPLTIPTPGILRIGWSPRFQVDVAPPTTEDGVVIMVKGWQVLSALIETTRPKHRERHKTVYYARPEGDQLGYADMPNPPYESPNDGNALAHNCLCCMVPIFGGEDVF